MAAHLRKNYGNGVSGKRTMLRDTRIGHLLFPVSSMVLTRTQLSKTKISINPEQRNHQELSESNDEYSVYRFSLSIQIQLTPSILIHPRLPRQASIELRVQQDHSSTPSLCPPTPQLDTPLPSTHALVFLPLLSRPTSIYYAGGKKLA